MEGTVRHLTGFGSYNHIWTAWFMNLDGLPHVPAGLRLHKDVAVLTAQIERLQRRRTTVSLAETPRGNLGARA